MSVFFFFLVKKKTRKIKMACDQPGIMYVRLRSALSICDTCPAFLVMNSSYIPSHCGGMARIWPRLGRDEGFASGRASLEGAGIIASASGSRLVTLGVLFWFLSLPVSGLVFGLVLCAPSLNDHHGGVVSRSAWRAA